MVSEEKKKYIYKYIKTNLSVAGPDSETWFQGLKLADQGMHSNLTAEGREEWQRLIPVMVKSFQMAREIIQRDIMPNEASLNMMLSFGLMLPLRFLLPFGDVAARWRLKCMLQAVRLLSSLNDRQKQSCGTEVHFLAPTKDVELDVLGLALDVAKPTGRPIPMGLYWNTNK